MAMCCSCLDMMELGSLYITGCPSALFKSSAPQQGNDPKESTERKHSIRTNPNWNGYMPEKIRIGRAIIAVAPTSMYGSSSEELTMQTPSD